MTWGQDVILILVFGLGLALLADGSSESLEEKVGAVLMLAPVFTFIAWAFLHGAR